MERPVQQTDHCWYDQQFENSRLDYQADSKWLSALAGKDLDEEDIRQINTYVTRGSIDLRSETDPETLSTVSQARRYFFEDTLGWNDPKNPYHKSYHMFEDRSPLLIPLATFIGTQRLLFERGFDNGPVTRFSPTVIGRNRLSLQEKLDELDQFGFDTVKVVNKRPGMLRYSTKVIQAKIDTMTNLGLDATKVINKSPSILSLNSESLQSKVEMLRHYGFDAARIITAQPTVLNLSQETVHKKMLFMKAVLRYLKSSISPLEIVNGSPATLLTSPQKIRSTIGILAGSVDNEAISSLSATQLNRFLLEPVDSIFSAVAEKHTYGGDTSEKIGIKHITAASQSRKSSMRRQHSLDILRQERKRAILGPRAIRAYLDYAPITPAELERHPELGSL